MSTASRPLVGEPHTSRFERTLDDDLLVSVLLPLLDHHRDAVALSATCAALRARLTAPIATIRAALPPPYTAAALDAALASGSAEAATPLVREAMRRLGRNLETISSRLLERGWGKPAGDHFALRHQPRPHLPQHER